MNTQILYEFGIIVKHGNLSSAAVELNTTQSLLSKHLAIIEEEVDADLFERELSPMKLTPVGEMVYREVGITWGHLELMKKKAETIKKQKRAVIKIGGLMQCGSYELAKAAERLIECDDETMSFEVFDNIINRQTSFESIRQHVLDVAFEPWSSEILDYGTESHFMFHDPAVAVVPNDHRFAQKESLSADDLENEMVISLSTNVHYALRKSIAGLCLRHGFACILVTRPEKTITELFFHGMAHDEMLILPHTMLGFIGESFLRDYVAIPFDDNESDFEFRAFYRPHPARETLLFLEALERCDLA